MKVCDEYCEVTCKWCIHYKQNEIYEDVSIGDCLLHSNKTNDDNMCKDFECILIDKYNDYI